MSPARRLASSLLSSLAIATLVAGCATGGSQSAPATAADTPAEPIAAAMPPTPAEPVAAPAGEAASTAGQPCDILNCGAGCDNFPVVFSDCWTSPYGPARADVVISPTNMLYCEKSRYALCYFSGPPRPTGFPEKNNPALPCVLTENGETANCTCKVFTSGPSYVDINGILNLGAWKRTVQLCTPSGAGCKNLAVCGQDPTSAACTALDTAPVCDWVLAQNPVDPTVGLMGKADLISTFSFALIDDYPQAPPTKAVDCTANGGSLYAGCMTAPCFLPEGAQRPPKDGDPIQCACPTYNGPFQIGQSEKTGLSCNIQSSDGKSYVWSASHQVPPGGSGN